MKLIDFHLGSFSEKDKACPYCQKTSHPQTSVYRIGMYYCNIKPHEQEYEKTILLVNEPCTTVDYERCPLVRE